MRRTRNSWEKLVHPDFRLLVEVYAKPAGFLIMMEEDSTTRELKTRVYARAPEKAVPDLPPHYVLTCEALSDTQEAHARALMDWLHLRRYKLDLAQDLRAAECHDVEAYERCARTMVEYHRLRCGRGLEPVKVKTDHLALMRIGLGMGLEKITAEQLAACFDEVCPCGRGDAHSSEYLTRLRTELIQSVGSIREYESAFSGCIREFSVESPTHEMSSSAEGDASE